MKCCFCGMDAGEFGNNVSPIHYLGKCCDKCNLDIVVPLRKLILMKQKLKENFK
jgi:hypothetical protein